MSTRESLPRPEVDAEIARLRAWLEIARDREEYDEKLSGSFSHLQQELESTLGKLRGGDIASADQISDENLKNLAVASERLKKFLP
ncbi:MAG: hypothetical protein AAB897_00790 [Patescibacteria group bacterium]